MLEPLWRFSKSPVWWVEILFSLGFSLRVSTGIYTLPAPTCQLAVESIQLTIRMQSRVRFGIPAEVHEQHDDLEEGEWYHIEILEKAENPHDEMEDSSPLASLISEKS